MPARRFRKRPVEVEAIQWTGSNEAEVAAWVGGDRFRAVGRSLTARGVPVTAEVYDVLHSTWVGVTTGQWVVRGVKGEFYPIAEDVLAETYDPVDED